jgi:hypothetical protein
LVTEATDIGIRIKHSDNDASHFSRKRESCGFSVVLLGSMRHSPVCFAGYEGSSALAIRSLNDLPPSFGQRRRPSQLPWQAGFQGGQECSATVVFGESPHGSVRYFDLRLAPDYAESLSCGKAQAAAMACRPPIRTSIAMRSD